MTVKIARGTSARILNNADHFVVQVTGTPEERVVLALHAARTEIAGLDGSVSEKAAQGLEGRDHLGPKYVSPVFPAATGPFLVIDGSHIPDRILTGIPRIVSRHLDTAGVDDALVTVPQPGGALTFVARLPRAVVLRLVPADDVQAPAAWLEEAATWVQGALGPDAELFAAIESIEFPLSARDGAAHLRTGQRVRAERCDLLAGRHPRPRRPRKRPEVTSIDSRRVLDGLERLGGRIRVASASFASGYPPSLALGAGGPDTSDDELVALVDQLRDVARRLAPQLAYACVSIEPNFQTLYAATSACDSYVPDAFPYQVLGPAHVSRLGGAPSGSRPLPNGRVELGVGAVRSWLPSARDRARSVLAPCLLRFGEGQALLDARKNTLPASRKPSDSEPPLPSFVPTDRADVSAVMPLVYPNNSDLWPSVVLRLYPPPPLATAPPSLLSTRLLEVAAAWVVAEGEDELWGTLNYDMFAIQPSEASALLEYSQASSSIKSGSICAVRADGEVRTAYLDSFGTAGLVPYFSLRWGRPKTNDAVVAKGAYRSAQPVTETLKDVARAVANDIAYAYMAPPSGIAEEHGSWSWYSAGGEHPVLVVPLCDEYVFDAFHYQLLGPGHVKRLGGLPEGGRALGNGRVELCIGGAEDWS
ncbi:MAG: hypothetical protein M3159_02725 [Actinomycetota bacterium]|nr:hypothetical protein [Actinomycetota bacterium]